MSAPPRAGGLRELELAAAVALVLTLVFTWPLAQQFTTGARIESGDGKWSVWAISWVAHALTNDPRQLWNANIFYPQTGTLAYSDPNIIGGLIAVPAWAATHNPFVASNWTTVWSFILSFVCMFALVRRLTGRSAAAWLAAVFFAFNSFTYAHLAHSQLLMTFGIPLSMLALHAHITASTAKSAALLGIALAIAGLGCGYYGIFVGLAAGFGLLWFGVADGRWRSVRYWLQLAVAAGAALAVVLPFVLPLLKLRDAGLGRTLENAEFYRAGWRSYLASGMEINSWILPLIESWREVLFPGFLSVALALFAIAWTARRRDGAAPAPVVWFYVALGALAFWASLGPGAGLYRLLFYTMPFMSLIRASSRFGIVVIFAVTVLAGVGFAVIERRWSERRRPLLLGVFGVAALVSSWAGVFPWTKYGPVPPAYTWLARLPRQPVAEFPFYAYPLDQHTRYMLGSTWHWQPLLNGYSDYTPPQFSQDSEVLATFPSDASIATLRERHVRYLVVHWHSYGEAAQTKLRRRLQELAPAVLPMLEDSEASLFELTAQSASASGASVGERHQIAHAEQEARADVRVPFGRPVAR